jgi:hypothetical protein
VLHRLPHTLVVILLLVGLTLPQAILALPIAAATIGPLPALAIVALVGVVMVISTAAEAEVLARDPKIRAGRAYYGMLVEDEIGARAAAIPNLAAGLRTGMAVVGAYVGLSVTMAALTDLPRTVWGVIAIVGLAVLLLRGGIKIPAGVGAALGLACLPLLIAIGAISATHIDPSALTHTNVPLFGGDASAADTIGSVLAVAIMLYLSSVYAVQVATETLPSAPSGRALVGGTAAGVAILTAIAGAWLMLTSGVIDAGPLSAEVGTVLGPLAQETGFAVTVLGTILIVLLLGLGIERSALAVSNLTAERLPKGRSSFVARHGIRVLTALPPLLLCGLGELMLAADIVSFTGVWQIAGVSTNILLSIALPLMLLRASRLRKGEHIGVRLPVVGHPVFVALWVTGSAILLVLFATVLWDGAARRVVAVAALVVLLVVVWLAWRGGAFRRRPA